jgi:hypothetical protein
VAAPTAPDADRVAADTAVEVPARPIAGRTTAKAKPELIHRDAVQVFRLLTPVPVILGMVPPPQTVSSGPHRKGPGRRMSIGRQA